MSRFLSLMGLSLIGLTQFASVYAYSGDRQERSNRIRESRPADLVVLMKKPHVGGDYLLGMYALEKDKFDLELRRFKLWREWPHDLKVHSESARCNIYEPLRVKQDSDAIYVRRINPGGLISEVNREDHLVWWAACVPELAGKDPEKLHSKALSLGYPTNLIESQEILLP